MCMCTYVAVGQMLSVCGSFTWQINPQEFFTDYFLVSVVILKLCVGVSVFLFMCVWSLRRVVRVDW